MSDFFYKSSEPATVAIVREFYAQKDCFLNQLADLVAMTHKCYRSDPDVRAITDLVTDEQMQSSFLGTNFGHTDHRGLLAQGCIKALAGWHQGHTLTTILDELRLITWNKQTSKIKVTAKGRHYIWLAFKNRPGV